MRALGGDGQSFSVLRPRVACLLSVIDDIDLGSRSHRGIRAQAVCTLLMTMISVVMHNHVVFLVLVVSVLALLLLFWKFIILIIII